MCFFHPLVYFVCLQVMEVWHDKIKLTKQGAKKLWFWHRNWFICLYVNENISGSKPKRVDLIRIGLSESCLQVRVLLCTVKLNKINQSNPKFTEVTHCLRWQCYHYSSLRIEFDFIFLFLSINILSLCYWMIKLVMLKSMSIYTEIKISSLQVL